MWGMVGMAASLVVAGLSASLLEAGSSTAGNVGIVCVVAYMFAFGASWGYGAWLYIPECVPSFSAFRPPSPRPAPLLPPPSPPGCAVCLVASGTAAADGPRPGAVRIMPLRVRGKAVGLCTFVNWGPANNLSATLTPW